MVKSEIVILTRREKVDVADVADADVVVVWML
jgi:hypothetical protein